MARAKLSIEDTIFFYFSSAPLGDAQEQFKKVRGILAHRSRGQVKVKRQAKAVRQPFPAQELVIT